MAFTVELLPPPSVNAMYVYAGKRRRVKTSDYKRWSMYACAVIKTRIPKADAVRGKFYVAINLPRKMAGDIDNRVKGILDALVTSGRIDDDKHMDELHVCRRADQEFAVIIVKPAGEED